MRSAVCRPVKSRTSPTRPATGRPPQGGRRCRAGGRCWSACAGPGSRRPAPPRPRLPAAGPRPCPRLRPGSGCHRARIAPAGRAATSRSRPRGRPCRHRAGARTRPAGRTSLLRAEAAGGTAGPPPAAPRHQLARDRWRAPGRPTRPTGSPSAGTGAARYRGPPDQTPPTGASRPRFVRPAGRRDRYGCHHRGPIGLHLAWGGQLVLSI
jgi:hypothetical protein